MRITIRVGGGRGFAGQDKELADFLNRQEMLRGRAHLIAERRQSGGMSQSVATVVIDLLGPAGVAFSVALIAWIRHRTADTKVTVRRADGVEFEISAQRVRGLGAAEVSALAEQIARVVGEVDSPSRPGTDELGDDQPLLEPEAPQPDDFVLEIEQLAQKEDI